MITNLHRILPSKENPGSNEVSAFSPHPVNFNENRILPLLLNLRKFFCLSFVHISCTLGGMQQITESQLLEKPSILHSVFYYIM